MLAFITYILFAWMIVFQIRKNKDKIEALSGKQRFGTVITFVLTVFIAYIAIYYGGNWLVSSIKNGFAKTVIQVMIVIFVISTCTSILNKVLLKLTHGAINRN